MGYIRKKNRSKKRKSNKNRSKKRQSYNRKRYLKGGVGSPVSSNRSTPSAASVSSTPYNSSFSTPSSNSTSSSAFSTPVGSNLMRQFDLAHQQQQLSDNRNTGNINAVGQWSPTGVANEYMNPNVN